MNKESKNTKEQTTTKLIYQDGLKSWYQTKINNRVIIHIVDNEKAEI